MDSRLRYRLANGGGRLSAKRQSKKLAKSGQEPTLCPFCGSWAAHIQSNSDDDAHGNLLSYIVCADCLGQGPSATGPSLRVWSFWGRRNASPEELSLEKRVFFPWPEDLDRDWKKDDILSVKLDPTLRPCPFCSSGKIILLDVSDTFEGGDKVWFAQCKNCEAGGPIPEGGNQNTEEAIQRWNDRVS